MSHERLACGCELWLRKKGDGKDYAHVAHCEAGWRCAHWDTKLAEMKKEARDAKE